MQQKGGGFRLPENSISMMKRLLFLLLLAGSGPALLACSCTGSDNFTIANGHPEATVVMAKKVKDKDHGMVLKVIEQFAGNPIGEERITVWGDVGHLCRMYTAGFENGETYIFGIGQLQDPLPDYWNDFTGAQEEGGDFSISVCGLHWLAVDGNQVKAEWGNINGNDTQMGLDQFRDLYTEMIPVDIRFLQEGNNPYISIQLGESITLEGSYQLVDLNGRVVKEAAIRPSQSLLYNIYYPELPSGIYVLRLQIGDLYQTRKFALNQP